jgi:hypothetical protein
MTTQRGLTFALVATAFVAVLEHNGVPVYVHPDQRPSGMAMVSRGAIDAARKVAAANVALLAEAIRQGTCADLLHSFQPAPGDCVFLPAGTAFFPVVTDFLPAGAAPFEARGACLPAGAARFDHQVHIAHATVAEEPLHRPPGVASNAEEHFGRRNTAIQVVVERRQADADFVGECLGLIRNHLAQPLCDKLCIDPTHCCCLLSGSPAGPQPFCVVCVLGSMDSGKHIALRQIKTYRGRRACASSRSRSARAAATLPE